MDPFSRKYVVADKIEVFALVMWVFSLFLMDVNHNLIGAYGNATLVYLIQDKVASTSMFWIGFFACCIFFATVAFRSKYHPKHYFKKLDIIFTITGILGLMIILSGGLLIFWMDNELAIPFFGLSLTRILYYHIGIGLEIFTILYFTLTK